MSEDQNKPVPQVSPAGMQESNRRVLKATIVGPILKAEPTTGQSKEVPQDSVLESLAADGKILQPPFDKLVLSMMPENSTELGPLTEAMAQNIDGFGFRFECRVKLDDPECPAELKTAALEEQVKMTNFFNTACVDYSFTELRKRTRKDIETTGEGFWEIIRVPATGQIVGLNHIPSHRMRLGCQDREFTKFDRVVRHLTMEGEIQLEKIPTMKRFRRYVQSRIHGLSRTLSTARGLEVRWFKEFNDPRVIDNRDGEVVKDAAAAKALPEEDRASELIHFKIYSPRTPHGLPRYIGNLITMFGDRAADEINYVTLRNNNIPSMVITVANGQLTSGTLARIQDFVETQVQGSDNYSRFLIIEGEGQYDGVESAHIKIDIKPLTQNQLRDQLFQEYGKNNREKLREAFRLPPIFVGRADDYTRATADSSRRLADEQVFKPERDEFDEFMNNQLLPTMGFRLHVFRSNGPNVTDDQDLIAILADAERAGGMTPRIARMILGDIFGKQDLPPMDPSVNLDIPFSLQLAEKVKNEAPIEAQPAVKSLGVSKSAIISQLLELRSDLEKHLARRGLKAVK